MLSRAEARDLILTHTPTGCVIKKDLSSALFFTLAHDLLAKRCQPPFDRIMMDGVALKFSDVQSGQQSFKIQAFQGAGTPALHLQERCCIEVATGALLPVGADTIVPYEDLEINADRVAHLKAEIKNKQFIHNKGSDYPQGQLLLKAQTFIGASELALLASNGVSEVDVLSKPRIALISTGDELVEPGQPVRDHEIYRSNVFALEALLRAHHFSDIEFFHLLDHQDHMTREIRQLLERFDVLIFSGGVSKGKKDFLPEVLQALGVQEVFHRVNQRPGKPLWFGVREGVQVFGLPGNPVSTQVTLRDYVIPSLHQRSFQSDLELKIQLASDHEVQAAMVHFVPARIEMRQNQLWAQPVKINTSGDFHSLTGTHGMLILDNLQKVNVFKAESFQTYRFWAKVF
jgi:molybdopterin molybdotransferase